VHPSIQAPIPNPTRFQLTEPPTSRVIEVPITPFILTLGFDEPQTGTAQDLEVLTAEIGRILSDYLFDFIRSQNTREGVMLESLDLSVTRDVRRRADNVFVDGERRLRALQTQIVNFQVSGNAVYSMAEGTNVTPEELAQDTDQAISRAMSDPQTLNELTREFQASTESKALSNTATTSAVVEAPRQDNGSDKPTLAAIIFGFLLVGLGAIVLCMYAWAFYKKRRKRRLQRKRERERGLGDSFNNTRVNTTASMGSMNSSINRSRSSPASKMMMLPPKEIEEDLSSSSSEEESESVSSSAVSVGESSAEISAPEASVPEASDSVSSASDPYAGIASDNSSKSDFTRELELAASLDRRSWIETQQQRSVSIFSSFDFLHCCFPSDGLILFFFSGDGRSGTGIHTIS